MLVKQRSISAGAVCGSDRTVVSTEMCFTMAWYMLHSTSVGRLDFVETFDALEFACAQGMVHQGMVLHSRT